MLLPVSVLSLSSTSTRQSKLLPVYQYLKARREGALGGALTMEENGILEKVEDIVRRGAYGLLQGASIRPTTAGPLPPC